jgi:DNA-binding HxlR family transcriptional regulator
MKVLICYTHLMMTGAIDISSNACSGERTFEILGGAWTFLVLREALFANVVQFDEFQDRLGIARASLRRVLARLVRNNVMEHRPLKPGGSRKGYFLTDRGRDLLPCLVVGIKWGQRWGGQASVPETITHQKCGQDLTAGIVCSECHQPVDPRDVSFKSRIHTRSKGREKFAKSRYVELPLLERQRPCSIAKTMATIGDPWSFLIIRECFYGVRRFDSFQNRLSIASNVLTVRLKRLVGAGVLEMRPAEDQSHVQEYRLTEKGYALYDMPLAIIAWGDRWLADEDGPPLILTHRNCGKVFHASLYCHGCDETVALEDVAYQSLECS